MHQAFNLVDFLMRFGHLVELRGVAVRPDHLPHRAAERGGQRPRPRLAELLVGLRRPDLLREVLQQAAHEALGVAAPHRDGDHAEGPRVGERMHVHAVIAGGGRATRPTGVSRKPRRPLRSSARAASQRLESTADVGLSAKRASTAWSEARATATNTTDRAPAPQSTGDIA
eukprot:CAMPEP_0176110834 /NCGR_PEP_ID=MMETSP0120_2-20121206/55654_1 /TAXON_ID=160619 /ORGANISM="Kryptoperidinium foliaceum, Strain CCMP 1326" /LENGTH=170 /DNA_ID=CAMNT_0017445041 /DNA_START=659 /DNA_END=1168 /DNA_ORIENTATION=+